MNGNSKPAESGARPAENHVRHDSKMESSPVRNGNVPEQDEEEKEEPQQEQPEHEEQEEQEKSRLKMKSR